MIKKRAENGKSTDWQTGEEVFKWWMEEDYRQITFEDLESED